MLLDKALEIIEHIKTFIKGLKVVGSVARYEPDIKDIDFITLKNLKSIYEDLKSLYDVELRVGGEKYLSVYFSIPGARIQIDIWKAEDKNELKFMKWMRTMAKGKRIFYAKKAVEKGMRLTDTGLYDSDGDKLDIDNLTELKRFLKQ